MVAIVHDVVGLPHSCMAVFYAYLDRVPVTIMGATGPTDTTRRCPQIDWIDNPPPDFATIAQGMGCYREGPNFNTGQEVPR
jgi:hypothetical protein